jgi:MFS family permease
MTSKRFPPARLSWIVWGLGALFYCSGFYQRVAPAVMTDLLMTEFQMGAAALGNLSAFYFYSYVFMQIPTGILADHLGPRKLLACGALVSAAGTFLFALAPSIALANLGRLLIGGSVAVAWVALLKLSTHWFPARRFAMVSGMALFCGILGAVTAGMPLRLLVNAFGWRPVMFASACVSLVLTAAVWVMVRDDPSDKGYVGYAHESSIRKGGATLRDALSGLRTIFRYANTWLLTFAPGGLVGPVLAFSGLWGVPFLSTHYGLTQSESALFNSILLVAWALGGPVLGELSDRIHRRKPIYLLGSFTALCGWSVILYVDSLPYWLLAALLTGVGFSSGCIIPGFAYAKESVPPRLAGTVAGVINMGVMMGPMLLQPVMGRLLDLKWAGMLQGGVRLYDLGAYRWAFLPMIAWTLVSVVLVGLTRETRCRQVVTE